MTETDESTVVKFARGTHPNIVNARNKGPKGNQFAVTHGFYSQRWSPEEKEARETWVRELIAEMGEVTRQERSLIILASRLNAILERAFTAIEDGRGAPAHDHLLAVINSFRLIMCALGLDRKAQTQATPEEKLAAYMRGKHAKEPDDNDQN